MKRTIASALLVIAGLTMSVQITSAQNTNQSGSQAGDQRVTAALDKLGIKYAVTEKGDFKVGMKMKDGRTQVAFINSETQKMGKLEIREILSVAYKSNGPLSAEVANKLLEDSAQKKLGAWQTLHNDKTYLAVFSAKIAAESDASSLETSLIGVMKSADSMEKELTGKDDF